MEIRNLLVFLDADEPCEARLALAAALAQRDGAALSAVCALPQVSQDRADGFAIGPEAVCDVLNHQNERLARRLEPVENAFRAALAAHALEGDWTPAALNETAQELAVRARCFDLAIVGRPLGGDRLDQRLAEHVALFSGTPCLVTPEGLGAASGFDRVLIAWNGGREAKRALSDGLVFIKRAKTVTLAVVGGEVGEAGPAANEDDVIRHLARHGVSAELVRVEAGQEDAGAALLRACQDTGADLMIMGAYSHSRAAEFVLGGATRTVLGHATLPVLMSH